LFWRTDYRFLREIEKGQGQRETGIPGGKYGML
jgi:hypothetical protein